MVDANEPLPSPFKIDIQWVMQMSPSPISIQGREGDIQWVMQMSPSPISIQGRGRYTVGDANEPLLTKVVGGVDHPR